MIANFFNNSKPINFLVLTVASIIIYFTAVLFHFPGDLSTGSFLKISVNLFLFLIFLFIHNFITRKNYLTENNSYALLIFILLFALFPKAIISYRLLVSNFFLFFAIRRIYSLRTGFENKSKLFDSGLWIGIATLFYSWSIGFLFLVYFAIIVFRKFKWNYFIIPVLGFLTPVYLYYVYLLVVDKVILFHNIWYFDVSFRFQNYNSWSLLIPISIILVFIMWSIYPTFTRILNAKKNVKATYYLLLAHLFLSVVLVIISPVKNGSELLFLFFPFSILFASYLQTVKDYWFKETLLLIFIVLSVVVNFLY